MSMKKSIVEALIFCIAAIFAISTPLVVMSKWMKDMEETKKNTTTRKVLLYSINTDEDISGRFIIGNGMISTKEYVTAYEINDDGGKKYYKMPREKTIIYDTLKQDEQAYAEVTSNGWGEITEIKLYVPENTIEKQINLEL